jgi:hypothetical protein
MIRKLLVAGCISTALVLGNAESAASLSEAAPDGGSATWQSWIAPALLALLVAGGAVLLLRKRWPGPNA